MHLTVPTPQRPLSCGLSGERAGKGTGHLHRPSRSLTSWSLRLHETPRRRHHEVRVSVGCLCSRHEHLERRGEVEWGFGRATRPRRWWAAGWLEMRALGPCRAPGTCSYEHLSFRLPHLKAFRKEHFIQGVRELPLEPSEAACPLSTPTPEAGPFASYMVPGYLRDPDSQESRRHFRVASTFSCISPGDESEEIANPK